MIPRRKGSITMGLAVLSSGLMAIVLLSAAQAQEEEPCCSSDADCVAMQNIGQLVSATGLRRIAPPRRVQDPVIMSVLIRASARLGESSSRRGVGPFRLHKPTSSSRVVERFRFLVCPLYSYTLR